MHSGRKNTWSTNLMEYSRNGMQMKTVNLCKKKVESTICLITSLVTRLWRHIQKKWLLTWWMHRKKWTYINWVKLSEILIWFTQKFSSNRKRKITLLEPLLFWSREQKGKNSPIIFIWVSKLNWNSRMDYVFANSKPPSTTLKCAQFCWNSEIYYTKGPKNCMEPSLSSSCFLGQLASFIFCLFKNVCASKVYAMIKCFSFLPSTAKNSWNLEFGCFGYCPVWKQSKKELGNYKDGKNVSYFFCFFSASQVLTPPIKSIYFKTHFVGITWRIIHKKYLDLDYLRGWVFFCKNLWKKHEILSANLKTKVIKLDEYAGPKVQSLTFKDKKKIEVVTNTHSILQKLFNQQKENHLHAEHGRPCWMTTFGGRVLLVPELNFKKLESAKLGDLKCLKINWRMLCLFDFWRINENFQVIDSFWKFWN